MHKEKKYFGTDGIRGRVGEMPIMPDFVLKLGWAVGRVLANGSNTKVLIGKDTRISGYMMESALEAGLSAAGVNIQLLGPMPTPAIAYLTRTLRAQAGIVISASHNPYYDNGVKFFSAEGKKLPDEIELAIEEQLQLPMVMVSSEKLGKASRVANAPGRYIEFCKNTIAADISLHGYKIVIDCANGAAYKIAPTVFQELGAEVIELAVNPNGININENCGATGTQTLQQKVLAEKANVGIALDGDGDRLIMVDEQGQVVDGDQLLFIIAKQLLQNDRLRGGVVGTLMSNLGLELALRDLGIEFIRSKVGDRYVMAELLAHNWMLGGESSGHIVCLDVTTTGDGIVSALQILATMVKTQKSLCELKAHMQKFPQKLINIKTVPGTNWQHQPTILLAIKDAEEKLKGRGRVLLRASGTEPLVRVMVEGEDINLVSLIAEELASIVKEELEAI